MTRSPDHQWTAPPPGAAPIQVCARCGAPRRPPATAEPCEFARVLQVQPARSPDYDPHNTER